MSQTIIRKLYEGRLDAWAKTRGLLVSHQNQGLTPVQGKIYLESFLLPGQSTSTDLEGKHTVYPGVFQINVKAPLDVGTGEANTLADLIAAQFPMNLRLTSGAFVVQQTSPASVGPGGPSDTRYTVPVSMRYRADVIT